MEDFIPATVTGYSEWPKNTPNYWALPAFGDVVGWTYRKDWFERPELQAEFKEKYGRDLAVPATFAELKDIAEFFQGREIDGKTVYGAAIYTERGSEGITMGAMDVLYSFGFEYQNPDKPYELEGFVNSPECGRGPRVLQGALRLLHPAGRLERYMSEDIDAYKSGQVALQMNFAFIWPGVNADPNVGGDKTGYFPNPAGPDGDQFAQLGGQGISVVASTRTTRTRRSSTSSGSPSPRCRRSGGSSAAIRRSTSVVNDPGFAISQPYAQTFLDSMAIVKDFWADPTYASLLQAIAAAASTTTWSPATAPRRRRWTGWSRTGPRSSRTTARCRPPPPRTAGAAVPRGPALPRCLRNGPDMSRRLHARLSIARGDAEAASARRLRGLSDRAIAWIFIAPTIALLLAINIFPLIWTVRLSFTNYPRQPAERRRSSSSASATTSGSSPTRTSG